MVTTPDGSDRFDVFISYNSADVDIAERVRTRLDAAGFAVWFDRARLQAGFDWYESIKAGCEKSRIVLPVLTPRWKLSPWTRFETYGHDRVIPLLCEGEFIVLDDAGKIDWDAGTASPPLTRFQAQAVDLRDDSEGPWRLLTDAIGDLLDRPQPEKAARCVEIPYDPNPHFVGRETELLAIHETLHQPPTAALTQGKVQVIAAMGGMGKTTLAREYIETFWRCYRQIFWIDCRLGVEAGLARICATLFPDRVANLTPVERAHQALGELNGDQTRLLVFDNAEDEASLRPWIPSGGACRTIITSRYADWSPGVAKLEMYVLPPEPAREFLIGRTGRPAEGEELAACDELARELGYLPLALEQAGAYLEKNAQYSFAGYLALYHEAQADLLAENVLGTTFYPDPVATTWRLTIARLTPEARAMFRLACCLADTPIPLGLFRGDAGLIRDLAHQLSTAPPAPTSQNTEFFVNKLANELHAYSLARQDGDSIRLHNLVQAVERLNTPTDDLGLACEYVWELLKLMVPTEPAELENWPVWEVLLPHVQRVFDDEDAMPLVMAAMLVYAGEFLHKAHAAYDQAETYFRRALEILENAVGAEDGKTLATMNRLAMVLHDKGDLEEAERLYDQYLACIERVAGPDDPDTLVGLNNLAALLQSRGRYEEAEPLYRRALTNSLAAHGEDDHDTLSYMANLATLLQYAGRHAEADALFRRVQPVLERVLGPDHPHTLRNASNLAVLLIETGNYGEAEELIRETLARREKLLGPDHPETLTSVNNLGYLVKRTGDPAEAERLYRRSLEGRRRVLGPDHPDTLDAINSYDSLFDA